jgi:hypothetical protein
MVYNATFNNLSVILWRPVLYWWWNPEYLEKTTYLSQVTDKFLSHNVISVVICIDYIGICKPNYHTITTNNIATTYITGLLTRKVLAASQ